MHCTTMRLLMAALIMLPPLAAAGQDVRGLDGQQQQRIGQGVASGRITAGGAARLENREGRINRSRRADLAANGGHLTPGEHRRLNSRGNAASSRIYNDKHNDIAQPGVVPR